MTPNQVIYQIKQSPDLSKIWAECTRDEKEEVVRRLETQDPEDVEKVLSEVKTGQNRLF
ncbi:MAG: hypothetical protein KDB79_14595 [Acidobacteria bacterium]|nr:hypothetical protein [Acidobacteriota bacterium]